MDDTTATQAPTTASVQPAPQPDAAPAPVVPSQQAPDLSGLTAPATQPNITGTQEYQQATTNEGTALQKANQIAQTPTAAPKAVPHAKLLAMVQGLSLGLDAFAKSAATHGREGGVQEVQQVEAAQQQQKIQAQQAAEAQKNTQIQQQLMVADTNHKMAQNILLLHTIPQDLTMKDLEVSGQRQTQAITGADFQATHGGMSPTEFSTALSGSGSAKSQTGAAGSFFTTNAQQQLDAGSKVLGADDPYVQRLQAKLSDPNATPKDLWTATSQLQTQLGLQEKATTAAGQKADLQAKQQAADPLYKYQSDPKALVEPGAQQALQAYIDNPANAGNLNGVAQAKTLQAKAGIAQQHAIDLDAKKAQANKNAEQAAAAGDPKTAGQLLYQGDLTLADLKSRGSTPKQIVDATNAAKDYAKSQGGTYNAADEITGEQILKGSGAQTFFGSARSLVQPSGMLDMMKQAHDALGNQKIPALNTILDWTNYNAGTPELAAYRSAVLGAADDYAKVMSGSGSPSDTKFIATENSFLANMNNKQFDSAVDTTRSNVLSQVEGRIGNNNYVRQREGDILTKAPAPAPSTKQTKKTSVANPSAVPGLVIH